MERDNAWFRRYLPDYCLHQNFGPITRFEQLVIDHSECLEDSYAYQVTSQLMDLLEDPVKNNKSLQIMHAIWHRLMRIRKYDEGIENPEEIKILNRKVSEKAFFKKVELEIVQETWTPEGPWGEEQNGSASNVA
jgi:hypothetical protein